MKMQYLGDAKDNFKWDYHNYLTAKLGYDLLNVVLMLNPDDDPDHHKTPPRNFHGGDCRFVDFCIRLQEKQDINLLRKLPEVTKESYRVELEPHRIPPSASENQVVFFDPDTGFEPPESRAGKEHVRFCRIGDTLRQISEDSVISVYQDLSHKKIDEYCKNYNRIKECIKNKIPELHSTAIYWQAKVMFVILAKSQERIGNVCDINVKYRDCIRERGGVVKLLDNNAA